jgi:hypothetical protein
MSPAVGVTSRRTNANRTTSIEILVANTADEISFTLLCLCTCGVALHVFEIAVCVLVC